MTAGARTSLATQPVQGEKLSWEGAGGLAPEKLPEYVDYVDPGDELEEEEC